MKLALAILSVLTLIATTVSAGVNLPNIRKSVFKVAMLKRHGVIGRMIKSGTGFYVNDKKHGLVMVTNNHICEDMLDDEPVVIVSEDGRVHPTSLAKDTEPIYEISMTPGMDICLVKATKPHPALELARHSPEMYEKITVAGFDGEDYMLYAEGRIFGYQDAPYFDHAEDRDFADTIPLTPEFFTAFEYHAIPVFKVSTQFRTTARIAPGYSGSPVLNEFGQVVGIVNKYDSPTDTDLRSYSYMHSVVDIKTALDVADFHPYLAYEKMILFLREWRDIVQDVGPTGVYRP